MLIADANDRMRLLLRSTLSDLEAEILEARTSESALECVRTHRPEWVMLEFNLRPLNGLVVAQTIRGEFPTAKIVMVTNCDDPEVKARAQAIGVLSYILKDDLLEVRKLIRSAGRQPPPARSNHGSTGFPT